MITTTYYIAYISGMKTECFYTYEEAWRYSERVYQETGKLALIEKVN